MPLREDWGVIWKASNQRPNHAHCRNTLRHRTSPKEGTSVPVVDTVLLAPLRNHPSGKRAIPPPINVFRPTLVQAWRVVTPIIRASAPVSMARWPVLPRPGRQDRPAASHLLNLELCKTPPLHARGQRGRGGNKPPAQPPITWRQTRVRLQADPLLLPGRRTPTPHRHRERWS